MSAAQLTNATVRLTMFMTRRSQDAGTLEVQKYSKQECIPVGFVPPAHWPYLVVSATHGPPATHPPPPASNTHTPPATHAPSPAMHAPPWTEFLTHASENIT